jgi:RimJ/RimL family protein N-acetyltransferase
MGQCARNLLDVKQNIRRLSRRDWRLMRDHLLRLDPESRYNRFGLAVSDAYLERYAAQDFDGDDLVFAYCVDGRAVAVGELRGFDRSGVMAEAAFSVERAWRGAGVGSALLERIVETACDLGVEGIFLTCLPQNRAMQKIVQKFARRCRFEADAGGRLLAKPGAMGWRFRESFGDDGYVATLDLPRGGA